MCREGLEGFPRVMHSIYSSVRVLTCHRGVAVIKSSNLVRLWSPLSDRRFQTESRHSTVKGVHTWCRRIWKVVENCVQYTTVSTNLLASLGEEHGITAVLGRPRSISAIDWLLYSLILCQGLRPPRHLSSGSTTTDARLYPPAFLLPLQIAHPLMGLDVSLLRSMMHCCHSPWCSRATHGRVVLTVFDQGLPSGVSSCVRFDPSGVASTAADISHHLW